MVRTVCATGARSKLRKQAVLVAVEEPGERNNLRKESWNIDEREEGGSTVRATRRKEHE